MIDTNHTSRIIDISPAIVLYFLSKSSTGGVESSLQSQKEQRTSLEQKKEYQENINSWNIEVCLSYNRQVSEKQIKNYKQSFKKSVRKLIIVESFLEQLAKYSREQFKYRIECQIMLRRPTFPFYPDDKYIKLWKYFIQVCQFLSTLFYPYLSCYQHYFDPKFQTAMLLSCIIFMIDIILNFLTAYVDDNSNLIIQQNKIIRYYVFTWFVFDALASIPYYYLTDDPLFSFLNWFRVVKYFLYRQERNYKGQFFDQNIEESLQPDNSIQLPRSIVFFGSVLINALLLIHIFGCLQHFFCGGDYITDIYWASQTIAVVGYGDIQPTNKLLTSLWMIIGVGYYSLTIGNFARLLSLYSVNSEAEDTGFQIEQLSFYCKIPQRLKHQIFDYVNINFKNNPFFPETSYEILQQLPERFKPSLCLISMLNLYKCISFFTHDINNSSEIVANCRFLNCEKDFVIYRQGQYSNEVYYLLSGDVRLVSQSKYTLINIMPGTIFGEIEAIEESPRITYALSMGQSVIMIIPYHILKKKMHQSQNLQFELQQLYSRRKQFLYQSLKKEQVDRKKIRRCFVQLLSDEQLKLTKEEYLKQREHRYLLDLNQYNKKFLQKIIGKKRQLYDSFLFKFKRCVNRIIDFNRQLIYTPPEDWKDLNAYPQIKRIIPKKLLEEKNYFMSSRVSSSHHTINQKISQMLTGYTNARKAEIKIQRMMKLLFLKKKGRPMLQETYQRCTQPNLDDANSQKIKIIQSKYLEKTTKEDIQQQLTPNLSIKLDLANEVLDKISNFWLRGSMQKFELYQMIHKG